MPETTLPAFPNLPKSGPVELVLTRKRWRVALFVVIFMLLSGVPTLFLGMTNVLGRMAATGVVLTFPILAMLVRPDTYRLGRIIDLFPVFLFLLFFIVSFLSNTFIFEYGLDNWLLSMYLVMPIFFYYLWWSIGLSISELVTGLIVIGILCAAILLLDQIFHFPQLNGLERLSAFDEGSGARRIVILRNENTLALLMMIVALFKLRRIAVSGRALFLLLAAGMTGLMIINVFESRMPIFAIMSATLLFLMLARISAGRRTKIAALIAIIAVPTFLIIFDRYVAPALQIGLSDYINEFNVAVRIQSFAYWQEQFSKTYGLGIGVMSTNPETPNIQSIVIEAKSFLLNDMGIAAALFQFGWVGLSAAIFGTIYLISGLLRLGRRSFHPYAPELLMMGCFVLAFELQPIPINFFTVQSAVPLGATLLYALRRGRWETARCDAFVRPASQAT